MAMDVAFAVLALHRAGPEGWCVGCVDMWARLAPGRCPTAMQALLAIETGGVRWDGEGDCVARFTLSSS
ncbi:MAG: hypothetical protein QOE61_2686 [Micromonosporaceae bacterium]|jgi:hypothetical protein|nr:hypothetical protein [Micromonosporaceae bacterium]